jgi:hypothetical protein
VIGEGLAELHAAPKESARSAGAPSRAWSECWAAAMTAGAS